MKKAFILVLVLGTIMSLSTPVFADDYQAMVTQIETRIQSVQLSDEDARKVEDLLAEGDALNKEGDTEGAISVLREALNIVDK